MTETLYCLQQIPIQSYPARLYLNGFPKAGLHLLELMTDTLVTKSSGGRDGSEWLGSFRWNSWSNELQDIRHVAWRLSLLARGDYLKGHMGHFDVIESVMFWGNIGHIFVVRDLRDVAVSLTHHIMSDDPVLRHQHKTIYSMLGGFDEILTAVIEGMGPYPSLFERWAKYAKWMELDWVMKVAFEDLISRPKVIAKAILTYSLYNATHLLEGRHSHIIPTKETERELVRRMVARSKQTGLSTTFRRGVAGEWRDVFKDHHKDLFKAKDTDHWLIKLEYAEDDNW